jgi:predicted AAA+ superfamily ATPase
MASALGISSPKALLSNPYFGALFETTVAGEIRRQLSTAGIRLYHWRSHGGAKVDLVIERDGMLYPIEIKAASHPNGHDARGLTAFRSTYPKLTAPVGLIIAPAETSYALSHDTWVVPWDSMNSA